jgi:transcriptional regulator with XRE-family HTH domain
MWGQSEQPTKEDHVLTPEEITARLADRNLSKVAEGSGLAYNTVRKYAAGGVANPSYEAVRALSDYLTQPPRSEP